MLNGRAQFSAAVVMSHHFTSDLAYLRALARSEVPYIGLLGPIVTRALLAALGTDANRLGSRLHAPVGLDLGADRRGDCPLDRGGNPFRRGEPGFGGGCKPLELVNDRQLLPVHALVLAAGASTRFGSPKQIARLGGATLLQRAINTATEAVGPAIHVILGAHATPIAEMLEPECGSNCPQYALGRGLGRFIRLGIERLPADCAGALLVLADQPYVTGASLARLISVWRAASEPIVASSYGAVIGAPLPVPPLGFRRIGGIGG